MLYFVIVILSGIIIAVVSEVAKRSPPFGALIVSLPLVSLRTRPRTAVLRVYPVCS